MNIQLDSIAPDVPLAEFEKPLFSKREVVEAGKLLATTIDWYDDDVVEAFRIAHNWRASYAYPMHRLRQELAGKVRRSSGIGITAGRLKRMISLRRKLYKGNITLYQIQDIAGVRAILPTMSEVDRVSALFEAGNTPHSIVRVNDYIAAPKSDGYRCRHIVLKYTGSGEDECYNRQYVEVQLRTHLQHAWATAVEAVGLMRDENLKGGQGSPDWLRFFAIMSSVIAENEGLPSVNLGEADRSMRIKELADINKRLKALVQLESYNQAIRHTEEWWTGSYRYFVMNFNRLTTTVTISPHVGFGDLSDEYAREEGGLTAKPSNAVVVEVDRVGDLKSAYPNYYLDVQAFLRECERALAPPPPKGQNPPSLGLNGTDLSFLTGWKQTRRRRGRGV